MVVLFIGAGMFLRIEGKWLLYLWMYCILLRIEGKRLLCLWMYDMV